MSYAMRKFNKNQFRSEGTRPCKKVESWVNKMGEEAWKKRVDMVARRPKRLH